jgi:anti-sigma B factor antagonist
MNELTKPREGGMNAFIRDSHPNAEIVHVLGEIDLSCGGELRAALEDALAGAKPVIVDLEACTYIDSTGLGILARTFKTAPERVRVACPNGPVRRIFDITGLTLELRIRPSLLDAIAA